MVTHWGCPCVLSKSDRQRYARAQRREQEQCAADNLWDHSITIRLLSGEEHSLSARTLETLLAICMSLADKGEVSGCHIINEQGSMLTLNNWRECSVGAVVYQACPERRIHGGRPTTFEELSRNVPEGRIETVWNRCARMKSHKPERTMWDKVPISPPPGNFFTTLH